MPGGVMNETNYGPVRIAMWSGPRNISTAMMRSFGNRADCAVIDEPFYGYYLDKTGINHPMRQDVLDTMPHDWEPVAEALCGPVPGGKAVYYQKHMTQHMLDAMDWSWLANLTNCFLIRDPDAVVASFAKKRDFPAEEELGFERQRQLFDFVRKKTNRTPPVVDSADILNNPAGTLAALCDAIGIPFDKAMLSWEAGKRAEDGVWGAHWYKAVEESNGFKPVENREVIVPDAYKSYAERGREIYNYLYQFRISG